jgi:cellulose synthase/poly-beta-1,6-N-acetylglucosamine synthase-like glycosyltransferase
MGIHEKEILPVKPLNQGNRQPMLTLLYVLAIFAYLYSFVLFIRFFIWRKQSWMKHWRSKVVITFDQVKSMARSQGKSLPFFAVMVPARDESKVIRRTIENLLETAYPKELYQIIIVTDEKERLGREADRSRITSQLLQVLAGELEGQIADDTRELLIAWLTDRLEFGRLIHLALTLDGRIFRSAFTEAVRHFLFEFVTNIAVGKPSDISNIIYFLRREIPDKTDSQMTEIALEIAMLARLIARGLSRLCGGDGRLDRKIQQISAQIKRISKRQLVSRISEFDRITDTQRRNPGDTRDLYDRYFLTTQQVVEECITSYSGQGFRITHAEVPHDFDGKFGGICTGESVRSTKGRALNYAFGKVDPQCRMVSFYDAESHPDHDFMLNLARWQLRDDPPEILQGPLFQVRNYYRMGILSRIGGLYKAIAHDWYLPLMFSRLPFVGGTNLHIDWGLIKKMRGFDDTSLTEDLEFGCRAYLNFGVRLDFLTVKSTEQTPPTTGQYFRQRLRWASGHIQVIRRIRSYPRDRNAVGDEADFTHRASQLWRDLILMGPFEWIVYQLSTLIVLAMDVILLANVFGASIPGPIFAQHPVIRWVLVGLNVPYLLFTFYCYLRYDEVFDNTFRPLSALGGMVNFVKLFIASFIVFLLPAPYSWSVILTTVGRAPKTWVKTPRTRE